METTNETITDKRDTAPVAAKPQQSRFVVYPGVNPWINEQGEPAPMVRVLIPVENTRPHVLKPVGNNVLLLMVCPGFEETDAAALVAVLEAQEARTVYVNRKTDENGVFLIDGGDGGDMEPVQIVAVLPRGNGQGTPPQAA